MAQEYWIISILGALLVLALMYNWGYRDGKRPGGFPKFEGPPPPPPLERNTYLDMQEVIVKKAAACGPTESGENYMMNVYYDRPLRYQFDGPVNCWFEKKN